MSLDMASRRLAILCVLLVVLTLLGMYGVVARTPVGASIPELDSILSTAVSKDFSPRFVYWSRGGYSESGVDLRFNVGDKDPFLGSLGSMSRSAPRIIKSMDILPTSEYHLKPSPRLLSEIRARLESLPGWNINAYSDSHELRATKFDSTGKHLMDIDVRAWDPNDTDIRIRDRVHKIPRWRLWIFSRFHI